MEMTYTDLIFGRLKILAFNVPFKLQKDMSLHNQINELSVPATDRAKNLLSRKP